MKYLIDGVEYAFDDMSVVTIEESQIMAARGMGAYTWPQAMGEIGRLAWRDGSVVVLDEADAIEHPEAVNGALVMESPRHLLAFTIFLWLCQRRRDPGVTIEQTEQLNWSQIVPVDEPDSEPDSAVDPTPPPASARGTGGTVPGAASKSSKGSKTRKRI